MKIEDYSYILPQSLIAKEPAVHRDDSRLFVYDTRRDRITLDYFYHIPRYLPASSFLVLNETKVLPSRITLRKSTGGKIRVLFLVNEQRGNNMVRAFVDRKINKGDELFFESGDFVRIVEQEEHIITVSFSFTKAHLFNLLKEKGTMPIPLYIKNTPLKEQELRTRYQTIFAQNEGSSAAPTASLHFTDEVFAQLQKKHIEKLFVTLHVGMGTFAPVGKKEIHEKRLHKEWYEVPGATVRSIHQLKEEGQDLVAVGTTVVRTLESLAKTGKTVAETDLFIYPPYEFKMVDHLITNFHLPKSSLMMLVEAFLQHKKAKRSLIDLYKTAIKEKFRFYSFGDAMLIL